MAIRKKDRGFDDILSDVVMNHVPSEYIEEIIVHLNNGQAIRFAGEEVSQIDSLPAHLEKTGIIDSKDMVDDVEITMDLVKLKKDMKKYVSILLAKHFENGGDSDDTKK